jgi:hypothetical protein
LFEAAAFVLARNQMNPMNPREPQGSEDKAPTTEAGGDDWNCPNAAAATFVCAGVENRERIVFSRLMYCWL